MAFDPIGWWRLFPELKRFDTREQRKRALQLAMRHARLRPLFVSVATGAICGGMSPIAARYAQRWWTGSPYTVPVLFVMALSIGIGLSGVIIGMRLFQRPLRRSLREQLTALGKPTCVGCGYDLRGLEASTPRCPECGSSFDPAVLAPFPET